MTKRIINWGEVIGENFDEIKSALETALRNALSAGRSYTGFYEVVELNADGSVNTYTATSGTHTMAAHRGEAITIARFPQTNVMEGVGGADIWEYFSDVPDLRAKFGAWLVSTGQYDADEIDTEILENEAGQLARFRPDLWSKIEDAYIKAEMDTFEATDILYQVWDEADLRYAIELDEREREDEYRALLQASREGDC